MIFYIFLDLWGKNETTFVTNGVFNGRRVIGAVGVS